ncbi:hypothetical protein QOZ80_4AG0323160 [Eleusine coracana subsp. coracana]|nr:hypothetical protein QOZ80_4AG0323160 [Eleusine coracana subsp. coracana]
MSHPHHAFVLVYPSSVPASLSELSSEELRRPHHPHQQVPHPPPSAKAKHYHQPLQIEAPPPEKSSMRTKRLCLIGDVPHAVRMAQYTKEEDMRSLLCQIHGFYKAALDLLSAKRIPSQVPRLLRTGVCLGVLDPVSNIIANTIAYSPLPTPTNSGSTNLKRLRRLVNKQKPMPEDLTHPCYSQPLQLAALRYDNANKKTKVHELPSRALVKCTEQRKKRRKAKNLRCRYFAECMKQIAKRMKKKRKMKKCIIEKRKVKCTQALKLLLLDKIHAHYLEALARLPGHGLRNRYHAGLLKAGFCYGPMDPVSNIILNTVWYATTFPTPTDFEVGFEVSMICTKLLRRVECGSLYGLAAFPRALFDTLTEHDAVWLLLVSNIDAALAITMSEQRGHVMSGAYSDAYRNAALDSWHPADPDALSNVATLLQQMDFGELLSLLNGHIKWYPADPDPWN